MAPTSLPRLAAMKLGIAGLGYVGLPLAAAFARAGHGVAGYDPDRDRVERLTRGESDIEDVPSEELREIADRFSASTDPAVLGDCEAILICVPTPLLAEREPDLTYVIEATETIASILREGQLVVLESTTYPGTTREELLPRLARSGLVVGEGFFLAYSPERIDPGRSNHSIRTTPKVVGGITQRCTDRAAEVYSRVCDHVVPVSTPEVAELSKLLENIFRSVNIALVNELARLADRMGIDIWEVIDAAATKPFGFTRFDPGPGMGGHCLPVDPFYLSWKAREYDLSAEFIELAGKVNQSQPYFCVEKAERALNEAGKPVRGSRILLVGVSSKAGVGDTRESPALKIAELLQARGGDVIYHDPHVAALPEHGLRNLPLEEALEGVDLAVIVTAHPSVDHGRIVERAPLVLDLRGTTRHLGVPQL